MKFFATLLISIMCIPAATADAYKSRQIILDIGNHLTLIGEVNSNSASQLIEQYILAKDGDVYIYIDSPGGSIIDGLKVIEVLETTPNKRAICIARFAASMAFSIFESCHTRLVPEGGVIMQHMGATQVRGGIHELQNSIDILRGLDRARLREAKRLGLTFEQFLRKIDNEWWMVGRDAIDNKAADGLVSTTCSRALVKKKVMQKIEILPGMKTEIEVSACPLISPRM